MKILLDVESIGNIIDSKGKKALLESVIGVLSSCDIQIDVLDKCIKDFEWYLENRKIGIIKRELKIKEIKKFLASIKIKILEKSAIGNELYASNYIDFGLSNYFQNWQLSYVKRENYYGLLTCNPETFQKANVAISPLDEFIFNYQFERIYNHKEPIIINYSANSISKIWYKKAYKYDISYQRRGIINSLPDLIEYINVANIDSEYFFRVTRDIDRELILDIVKLIRWNRFGKTVICSASNIEIAVHFWNKNAEGNYHLHNNCICASYVLSGELTEEHYETGKIIKHSQGKWNFVNLGTNHKLSNCSSVCLTLVVFKVFKQDNNLFESVENICNA